MVLVVVVPTYNEIGSLERLVTELLELEPPGIQVQVLIVDDASTDGTAQAADELARRFVGRIDVMHRSSKRGLGSAYVDGFTRALANGGDLIAQMDADLSHEPSALAAMIAAIDDADLVIGSRYIDGGAVAAAWGWHRKLLSWLANRVVVRSLLSLPTSDATSGYRLWRRDALARIAPSVNVRSSGYGFQVEMVYLAHHLGCRITEIPIHFRQRVAGESKVGPLVAIAAARDIVTIRRQHADAHGEPASGSDGVSR